MIRITADNGEPKIEAEMSGRIGVYLDNDSLMELAKGEESRRDRFIKAIRHGGTLLFSMTNAVEICGPQGRSAELVRAFLDRVGHYWIPLEMDPFTVVQREESGLFYQAPMSEQFIKGYVQERLCDRSKSDNKILDLSEIFFRLSAVFDWVQENRNSLRKDASDFDTELQCFLGEWRTQYEKDDKFLDRMLPPVLFDSHKPAKFVMFHLLRLLVIEARAFQSQKHDGMDFCHAVLAVAYGSLVTLDKQWKRRIEKLPTPNCLAKVYYRPEVNQLVDLLELLVSSE